MNTSFPIYIERKKTPESATPVYAVRPLFAPDMEQTDEQLSSALNRLVRDVRRHLYALSQAPRHDGLIPWTFCPDIESQRLTIRLSLRRRTAECRLLFVAFQRFDRRVAFSPGFQDIWFDLERGASLVDRATEIYTEIFRQREKDGDDVIRLLERASLEGRAWVEQLEVDFPTARKRRKEHDRNVLMLFPGLPPTGAQHLDAAGRCLDWLYPDELDRACEREQEVAELMRGLADPSQRPILLVGPPKVGKTTLVHECVHRRVAARKKPFVAKQNVWLLSPQRLISGMSYLGQWEQRVVAIIEEAREKRHVLYFDDLLGLFHAGITSHSRFNVALLMKPYIERREIRVLGETTPEAFRVLKERDRGLADLFHVIQVKEPKAPQITRILVSLSRRLEDQR